MSAALRHRAGAAVAGKATADPLAERLRMTVGRLARLLRQQDEGGFGQTAMSALATIAKHGPLTLGELATRERVAPPSITKVVERLVGEGFVRKDADPNDRRVSRVRITRPGQRQLERTRQVRTEWLAARLDELGADELERLVAALDVLDRIVTVTEVDRR